MFSGKYEGGFRKKLVKKYEKNKKMVLGKDR